MSAITLCTTRSVELPSSPKKTVSFPDFQSVVYFQKESSIEETDFSVNLEPVTKVIQRISLDILLKVDLSLEEPQINFGSLEDYISRFHQEENNFSKLKLYSKLFEKKSSTYDSEKLKLARIELFSHLSSFFQEEIKFSIWKNFSEPETFGTDFGYDKFVSDVLNPKIAKSVLMVKMCPRYLPKSDKEDILVRIQNLKLLYSKAKTENSPTAKFYALEHLELMCMIQSMPKEIVWGMIFENLDDGIKVSLIDKFRYLSKAKDALEAEHKFKEELFSTIARLTIRHLRHEYLLSYCKSILQREIES